MADQELDILIRLRSELAGGKAAADALEQDIQKAEKLGQRLDEVGVKKTALKEARDLLGQAEGTIDSGRGTPELAGALGEMGKQLRTLASAGTEAAPAVAQTAAATAEAGTAAAAASASMVPLAAALAAVSGGFLLVKNSLAQYAAEEQRMVDLQAVLAQRGLLSDGYLARLEQIAAAQSRITGKSREEWQGVISVLTQVGATGGNIEQAANAVAALAPLMGNDLDRAAAKIGESLSGSTRALEEFTGAVDRDLPKAKQIEEQWRRLGEIGGGQLAASTSTLSGLWSKLGDAWSGLLAPLGAVIAQKLHLHLVLRGLIGTVEALAWVVDTVGRALGAVTPKAEGLANASRTVSTEMDKAAGSTTDYKQALHEAQAASQQLTEQLGRQLAAQDALKENEDRLAEAQLSLDLANVRARAARGEISGVEAERQTVGLRSRFEVGKVQRMESAEAAKRAAREDVAASITESILERYRDTQGAEQLVGDVQLRDRLTRRRGPLTPEEAAALDAAQGRIPGGTTEAEALRRRDAARAGNTPQMDVEDYRRLERLASENTISEQRVRAARQRLPYGLRELDVESGARQTRLEDDDAREGLQAEENAARRRQLSTDPRERIEGIRARDDAARRRLGLDRQRATGAGARSKIDSEIELNRAQEQREIDKAVEDALKKGGRGAASEMGATVEGIRRGLADVGTVLSDTLLPVLDEVGRLKRQVADIESRQQNRA